MTEPQQRTGAGVRTWMATQYVAIAGYVGALWAIVVSGGDLTFVLVACGMITLGMVFFVSPRRPWWSPEVGQLMGDPAQARRYRIRMTVALVAAVLASPLLIALLVFVVGTVQG